MAAGTPRQQGPVACEPRREEQTSLPLVSHQNTTQLHVYSKHPLPDSAVWGPGTTVNITLVVVVVALLGGHQGSTCLAMCWYGTGVEVSVLCLAQQAISNPTKEGVWLTRSPKGRMELELVSKSLFFSHCQFSLKKKKFPLLIIHTKH